LLRATMPEKSFISRVVMGTRLVFQAVITLSRANERGAIGGVQIGVILKLYTSDTVLIFYFLVYNCPISNDVTREINVNLCSSII